MESSEHSERGQITCRFFPPWRNYQTHCQRTPRLSDRVFLCQAIEVSCLSSDRYSFPLICFKDFHTKRSWKCIKFHFMKMFIDWSSFLIKKQKNKKKKKNTTMVWPFLKGHAIINTKQESVQILDVIQWASRNFNWASSWDYGTYNIGDQRRLRRTCASAPSRQSLRCSHTWSMEVDEECSTKNQTSSPVGWLRMRVWRMNLYGHYFCLSMKKTK